MIQKKGFCMPGPVITQKVLTTLELQVFLLSPVNRLTLQAAMQMQPVVMI